MPPSIDSLIRLHTASGHLSDVKGIFGQGQGLKQNDQ